MSNENGFTIINRRDAEEEECDDNCGNCSGNCGKSVFRDLSEGDDHFKPGDIVASKLTGDAVMIIKYEPDNPPSYVVRTKNYEMTRLFVFELAKEKLNGDND